MVVFVVVVVDVVVVVVVVVVVGSVQLTTAGKLHITDSFIAVTV